MMQRHDSAGRPLCGSCLEPVVPGQLYLAVFAREAVDQDPGVMVHLEHFRGTADRVCPVKVVL